MTERKTAENSQFDHIETWIFDLDNTLYPAACRLFDQVDERIGRFIVEKLALDPKAARTLQKRYFKEHGTTLSGLMKLHGTDPHEFLDYVHDIDRSAVQPSQQLNDALGRLDGRKVIFTNGSADHAHKVMERLEVSHHFEAVFDIVAANYVPKPAPATYQALIDQHAIDPRRAVLIDDISHNLRPAADLGMTTVWVRTEESWAQPEPDAEWLDHTAEDLASWLIEVTGRG
jgi:putative hydrolase of the HAD superfamily